MNLEDLINSLNRSNSNTPNDVDSIGYKQQLKLKRIARFDSDTKDRKWLAKWTAYAVSLWLLSVLLLLFFNEKLNICLSDVVLITLLGTTTLNVLGLSFIVLRGHFSTSES